LADGKLITNDPVAGLIDFPLPKAVSLLPQTWESRLALALLLAAIVTAIERIVHYRRVNRYRREALAELHALRRADRTGRPDMLVRLSLLVRRTALAAFPRQKIASLAGHAWLEFLDRSYGGNEFSQGVGRLLASGPYRPIPLDEPEFQSLTDLVRRWIKGHHA
jgi:hypothetical protein